MTSSADLDRQIIKSDAASLSIPSLQLEIPPHTQKGSITTIEGMLKTAASNLERDQGERLRIGDVDNFHRCRHVISNLYRMAGSPLPDLDDDDYDETNEKSIKQDIFEPFDIILDDPSGNSFIENPHMPASDPHIKTVLYTRTPTQDMQLGLQPSQDARAEGRIDDTNPSHKNPSNYNDLDTDATNSTETNGGQKEDNQQSKQPKKHFVDLSDLPKQSVGRQEVIKFPTDCPNCRQPAETDMCITDIPHFKEVIIMSLYCESCGYRSNEVKGGGAIPAFGTKITLQVNSPQDLEREVLKSDTGGIEIPELDMELMEGGLDGLYTTVEGLMNKLHSRLVEANPFGSGDAATKQHRDNDAEDGKFSQPSTTHAKYMQFLSRLKDMASANAFPFTLIISDPLSNSFIGPIPEDAIRLALQAEKEDSRKCYDDYVDNGMTITEFERSQEQNDDLGLSDMKTENYQEDEENRINYGTDIPSELPDRLTRADQDRRGPDHPHKVGMAPVEDSTKMGADSVTFAAPGMQQRGKQVPTTCNNDYSSTLKEIEQNDDSYIESKEWIGQKTGMVFKNGAKGVGYYLDTPIVK